jgi:predicted amidophosphoribosyltransferase
MAIELAPPQRLGGVALDDGFAPLPYEGAGRRLITALKFQRLLVVAELGAALIVAGAPARMLAGEIVPVPAAAVRLARRGFDPAAELAMAIAGATGLTVWPCLRRLDSRPQRGRSRRLRLSSPPRFAAAAPVPERALLVDDVATTGATLDGCAAALREAGCRRIEAVTLAAVPPPGSAPAIARRSA